MKKINLNLLRLDILKTANKTIVSNGWNNNIFSIIAKKGKFKKEEMMTLFPNGYKSLLKFYLSYNDMEMTSACQKINLIRMKTHERIETIILLKLKINKKNKSLFKRTFFSLMLPHHNKIAIKSVYNTIDQIWYLAGDNSVDFSYYTKRAILAGIYISTIFYWINNSYNLDSTKKFLNLQLKNISKIPKIKQRFKEILGFGTRILSFAKRL